MFKTPEDRLSEIQLYDMVAEEIANGEQVRGLWFKAIADSEGDEEKAKPLYLKYRVQMIRDEWAYAEKVATQKAEQEREAAERQAEFEHAKQRENEKIDRIRHDIGPDFPISLWPVLAIAALVVLLIFISV